MTDQLRTACHIASQHWPISGDQIFCLYNQVSKIDASLATAMKSDPDFADILGDDETRGGGKDFFRTLKGGAVHDLKRGVTLTWLTQAFGLTRMQAEQRLSECPVLRAGKNGMKVYDFAAACSYLAKPRVDLREYIETLTPEELPEHLRQEFWRAKLLEQKWRRQAGELPNAEDSQ